MPCATPYWRKEKHLMSWTPLSCGQCEDCRLKRTQQWVIRMKQELGVSYSAYFITLTYDDTSLPVSKEGFPTLFHKDIQNFLKALRKENEMLIEKETKEGLTTPEFIKLNWDKYYKLKYYMAGEYGEKNSRPHYHLILFNLRGVRRFTDSLYKSHLINKLWKHGVTHIGSFTSHSAAYCVKYIDKKKKVPEFPGDDRKPEYSCMSKGIGKYYINAASKAYHGSDIEKNYITDGKVKVPLPRYYRDQLFTEEQKEEQRKLFSTTRKEMVRQIKLDWNRYYPQKEISFEDYLQSRIVGKIEADKSLKNRNL